jgi:alkylation response protein AidB-like acyl-CoA dehydrogenase
MDTVSYVLAMEEISKWDASTSVVMSVNNSLVCYGWKHLVKGAKQKYLTPLAQGKKNGELYIGAFMLSEPKQEVMQHRKEQQQKIKAIIIY